MLFLGAVVAVLGFGLLLGLFGCGFSLLRIVSVSPARHCPSWFDSRALVSSAPDLCWVFFNICVAFWNCG